MKARRSLLFVLLAVVLGVAAWSAGTWLPWSVGFVTQNTNLIQALTDLVQLVMWIVAAGAFVLGIWRLGNSGDRTETMSAGTSGLADGEQKRAPRAGSDADQPSVGERGNVSHWDVKNSVIVTGDGNVLGSMGDGQRVDERALEDAYLAVR